MRVVFGDFELDLDAVELRSGGDVVAMEPRVFDVLAHLVRNRDRVVSKEELLDGVWGDRFVSESALSSCIRHVRRALGDDGGSQRFVKTAHGRGYRFVAEATELDAGPVTAMSPSARDNLPADRTELLGRHELVERVADVVARHRLVTLLGMGGVGKTRVAVAAGRAMLDRFPDGVWFVDLVPADDERSVDVAVAVGCGIALSPGDVRAQLAAVLADRRVLVVLDNAEHVHAAASATVDHLLEHTSEPRFVVTSREPLGVRGEHRVPVAPLPVDGAVALFLAVAARFGAAVDPADLDAVRHLCVQLDGLPLAIELAAALLRVLDPRQLAERLDQRFELLRAPAPGGDRHASLAGVLDDTWGLLSEPEQALLGDVAELRGSFTFDDVDDLVDAGGPGDVVAAFGRLVDRSLVVAADGTPGRFRVLETVRAFSATHTDRSAAAGRHADWCLRRAGDDLGVHLFDFGLAAWVADHFDDLRAAEANLVAEGRHAEAARLTGATSLAIHCDSGARAASVLDRVDAHLGRIDDPAARARLHMAATMAAMAARSPAAIARHGHAAAEEAAVAGDPVLRSVGLVLASWSTVFADPAEAQAMVEEASALARAAGDRRALDHADSYRAFHLAMQRRWDEASEQAAEVVDRSSEPASGGQATLGAMVAWTACNVLAAPSVAGRFVDELLARPSRQAPMWGNQVLAATVHAAGGDATTASHLVAAVCGRLHRAGQDPLPDVLVPAAMLAHARGDDRTAARWLRAVRDAGRPTQSFQVTCAYRRLREAVGTGDDAGRPTAVADAGREALDWMARTAG